MNHLTDLLVLLKRKYSNHKNYDFFLNNFIISYNFCLNKENIFFKPVTVYRDNILVAHVALIIDKRLPKTQAFFGFLELENDQGLFDSIWEELLNEARNQGIVTLNGPVNGSIWHQYRCIKETDDSDFFKTELIGDSNYYNFLISKKPDKEVGYHSGYREKLSTILKILESVRDKLPSDFSIKVSEKVEAAELKKLAQISKQVFSKSWGYTELNESEFLDLYSLDAMNSNVDKMYLLYKKDELIGFLSTLRDGDTLICKTICILPEFQGLGLGNFLAYHLHKDAVEDNIRKVIYALVRDENKIKNFPQDDIVIFRRYSAFEFKV